MRTLIIYGSKYGYTSECAELIADLLNDEEVIIVTHLDHHTYPTLSDYERIIIGGGIYMGRLHRKVRKFIENNRALLLTREIGLFLSCLSQGIEAEKLMKKVFPADILEHAKAVALVGGCVELEKLNPLYRKLLSSQKNDLDRKHTEALEQFTETLKAP